MNELRRNALSSGLLDGQPIAGLLADDAYDRGLLGRMYRDTGRTDSPTWTEQRNALSSAGRQAVNLLSDVLIPQTPADWALTAAMGPWGRMARIPLATAGFAMQPSDAEAARRQQVAAALMRGGERAANGAADTATNALAAMGRRNGTLGITPLERAAEQGYTIDAYKGMLPETGTSLVRRDGQWVEEGTRVPVTEFNNPSSPYAGFFSSDPEVANRFARVYGRAAAVYPTRLRFSNPVEIDAAGRPAGAFQFEQLARTHGTEDEMRRFRAAFADGSPHDGVILRNTADEATVYIPRTPQQARSRFADFTPGQENNPNMLASYLPYLLGGGLLGAQGGGQ